MKVKELLERIEEYKQHIGDDFLNYDVYTEQCTESDKQYKRTTQNWEIIGKEDVSEFLDSWEYFMVHGFNTIYTKEKIFTINVNY